MSFLVNFGVRLFMASAVAVEHGFASHFKGSCGRSERDLSLEILASGRKIRHLEKLDGFLKAQEHTPTRPTTRPN